MLAVETIGRIRREHLSKASRSRRSAASFGYRGNTLQRNLHASKEPARFKGTCTRGLDDNLKTAVETGFIGKDRQLNRRFLPMCGHYLVEPTAGGRPGEGAEPAPAQAGVEIQAGACPGAGEARPGGGGDGDRPQAPPRAAAARRRPLERRDRGETGALDQGSADHRQAAAGQGHRQLRLHRDADQRDAGP
jgi:hypothetical protein